MHLVWNLCCGDFKICYTKVAYSGNQQVSLNLNLKYHVTKYVDSWNNV